MSSLEQGAPRPRILAVSFSPLDGDARVLRQLNVLSEFGDVTTVGYGPAPTDAAAHIEIAEGLASLPQTIPGVIGLALRRMRASEFAAPALSDARSRLTGERFDLIVANDARALPLAHELAQGAPVWADMHEWAPEEQAQIWAWRVLVSPFMTALCRRYLPQSAAVTTVSPRLAQLYESEFGAPTEVVSNARAYEELEPTPVSTDRVRLVHSGIASRDRGLEILIDAVLAIDERFTLDLYLVFSSRDEDYRQELSDRASGSSRISIREAVSPAALPATLNAYDLGVFVLRPQTRNHRFMLPNKFFDFVQARLGVVFSPAAELDSLIASHQLGLTLGGFEAADLVAALRDLTPEQIERFKAASDRAARELSADRDAEVQRRIIRKLLGADC